MPKDSQVLFHKAPFQLLGPQSIQLHGVTPPWVQEFAFPFAGLHKVPVGPFLSPVKVPPSGVSAVPPRLVSSADLLRVHSVRSCRS